MRLQHLTLRIALLVTLPAGLAAQQSPADLIVTNARIYTVDERRPFGEAMVIAAGRVRFVGSERGALALKGPRTRVIDLDGRTVIPGMVDAHAHLLGLGNALRTVDLTGTRSYDEVIARVDHARDDDRTTR
jgi:predicted amidohydrolase YtcJ